MEVWFCSITWTESHKSFSQLFITSCLWGMCNLFLICESCCKKRLQAFLSPTNCSFLCPQTEYWQTEHSLYPCCACMRMDKPYSNWNCILKSKEWYKNSPSWQAIHHLFDCCDYCVYILWLIGQSRYQWQSSVYHTLSMECSYLVSEVHVGSMLDQLPYNRHAPSPSCYHEGCFLILQHRVQVVDWGFWEGGSGSGRLL